MGTQGNGNNGIGRMKKAQDQSKVKITKAVPAGKPAKSAMSKNITVTMSKSKKK